MRHLLFALFAPLICQLQLSAMEIVSDAAGGLHIDGVADLNVGLFDDAWKHNDAVPAGDPAANIRAFTITNPSGGMVRGSAAFAAHDGVIDCTYVLTADQAMTCNALMVAIDLPSAAVGSTWKTDAANGILPANGDIPHLFAGKTGTVALDLAGGHTLSAKFPQPSDVVVQDNHRWGPGYVVRMGPQPATLKAGEAVTIAFTLRSSSGLTLAYDRPVTITAGAEWIPLTQELDVEPGSALDWSTMGFTDAPAGKHGRVIANGDDFAFADQPTKAQRFYGVNLCFSANYLDHALADKLADRLRRAGYNSVRIHHYERGLTDNKPGLDWSAEALDQFDYLAAALIARGMYLTTDLYVSRPVEGVKNPKVTIPVDEAAFQDWRAFVLKFLGHTNPYTKRTYAAEPALAWLVMINEGNLANYWKDIHGQPLWNTAWATWRTAHQLPAQATLPDEFHGADVASFFADTEQASFRRMSAVVRDELHCAALQTNTNGWTNLVTDQGPRVDYDYVDDHFYVDHPRFIEHDWALPSRCDNRNPLLGGTPGGSGNAFVRLWGKPFTISEFNYSAPGRYRAVGGMLTGALGALQDWSSIWRFAYSHSREAVAGPRPMNYFDVASDPLNAAAERAAILIYLRGDLAPATKRLSMVLPAVDAKGTAQVPNIWPAWSWASWRAQVGVGTGGNGKSAIPLPLAATDDQVRAAVGDAHSGLVIDAAHGAFTLDTERLAGGFAEQGGTITAGDRLTVDQLDQTASVTVAALDGKPLRDSDHLLLTHLTDVQNSGARYGERARRTLLAWGDLPHLAAAGSAHISLSTTRPLEVWSLTIAGKRVAKIPTVMKAGRLEFTVAIAGNDAHLYYELTASPGR